MSQRALVVDDDMIICKLIQAILRSADMDAWISTDSAHALELLRDQKFDAIFLDMNMPSPDGIELTKLIRASTYNQKTPVIIVSGEEDPGVLGRAFQAGASFFLFKPIDRDRLLNLARATPNTAPLEKRHYQRVAVSCGVQVLLDGDVLEGETIDVSLNGILVRADRTFPVGSRVGVRITLHSGTPISVKGTMVRMAGPDMGIHLENIGENASRRLQDFLQPLILAVSDAQDNLAGALK